jgi:hypothetical protein
MKNGKFLTGLVTGIAAGAVLFILLAHRPAPGSSEAALPQYSGRITSLTSDTHVYRLTVDNVQYIVVASEKGGTAITRHK